jgi:DNA (cytosine-5)-methyltransferase 1
MNFATLFTGGGLFDIGAKQAGLTDVFGVEIDAKKAAIAETNGLSVLCADVEEVDYRNYRDEIFLLHASPQCKEACLNNPYRGESLLSIGQARSTLRAVSEIMPRFFTLENVGAYQNFDSFKDIVNGLLKLRYEVTYSILNFANYGVPQTRRRLILIASLDNYVRMPMATHLKKPDIFIKKRWVSWYDALANHDLPYTEFSRANRRVIKVNPSKAVGFITSTRDSTKKRNTLRWADQPCFTLLASNAKGHIKGVMPDGWAFRFDVPAYAAIHTVPVSYQLSGYDKLDIEVIGNGVSCLFAKVLCEHLIKRSKDGCRGAEGQGNSYRP